MKPSMLSFLCLFLLVGFCFSCTSFNSNQINLTVSEDEEDYKVLAAYPEDNTQKVETYLNETIGDKNHISFTNTTIDALLTLDDGTKMYVNNKPGKLQIKLNKRENSAASYREVKALGEGLQPFLNKDK